MKKSVLITAVFIALLGTVSQTQTGDRWFNGVSEPWSFGSEVYTEEEAAYARSKWEQIGEEQGTSDTNIIRMHEVLGFSLGHKEQ